jgi:hypothetical protein
VRARLGLAPQALALYDGLSGDENVAFFGSVYGLSGARLAERVKAAIEFVGLADRRRDRVSTYSGGMKRRLNLAVALVHVGGICLSVYSAALIDAFELAGVRQLNAQRPTPNAQLPPIANSQELPTLKAQGEEFKTVGPYGWVRHPIYLGWFLIVFAVGTMTMTRFVFAVVSCTYVLMAIPFEERSIRKTAGGAYDRYMKQVPRKLLPGLY